jgi:hypothetical protein
MKIEQQIINRFQQLIDYTEELAKTQTKTSGGSERTQGGGVIISLGSDYLDAEMVNQWGTSCLHLLRQIFGQESDHYTNFKNLFPQFTDFYDGTKNVRKAIGVLKAAKDDYENGYLFDTRVLIEAEVFDDFLEQAEHLLKQGYFAPAAIIAGCVLEDGLRKLCLRNSLVLPAKATIEPMNVELAKAGIYNKLVQKKVTALADLRNKAAHGEWTEFNEKDVEDTIRDVRRFMEDYFS